MVQGLVQGGQGGTYYVAIDWEGSAPDASYSLTATAVGLSVDLPVPAAAPAANDVSLGIGGSGFTLATQVSLVSGHTTIAADQVDFRGTDGLLASFDLSNAPLGDYAIEVSNNGETASTASSFIVFASPATIPVTQDNDSIVASLDAPAAVRAGQVYSLTIDYYSDALAGTTVQAPIFQLAADNVEFQLPGQTGFTPGSILLLGINSSGQAGALPGTTVPMYVAQDPSITVNFIATTTGSVDFSLGIADPSDTIDWSSNESHCSRPEFPLRPGTPSSPISLPRSATPWAACKRRSTTTPTT